MRFRPLLSMLALSLGLLPFTSCTDDPSLTSIVISPTSFAATLVLQSNGEPAPASEQLWTEYTATGYYTHPGHEAITKDLTKQVTWLSYTPLLVTINSSGVATVAGTATGNTQITASMQGFHGIVVSNASDFSVSLPNGVTTTDVTSLAITPSNPSVAAGTTEGFVATGTTGTGSSELLTTSATWISSNPSVATIGAHTGLAATLAAGSTIIVATYTNPDGLAVTATTQLTVQ
jgi:trimeric autotransporter adhesin